MESGGFEAGAAEASIHQIQVETFLRMGRVFDEPAQEQKMRCLVLAHGDALTAIFNADWGHWFRGHEAIQQAIQQIVPNRSVLVLCFGTGANHDIDLDPILAASLEERHRGFDPVFQKAFVQTACEIFVAAFHRRRRASVAAGAGQCASVTRSSYQPEAPTDPVLHVLRFDDSQGNLIAVIVNFSCRSDDVDPELSAGIPGSLEALVQKVYGPSPVLFLNSAGGEFYKAMRHVPPLQNGRDKTGSRRQRHETLTRELDRIGRVLGGEVCKVLAELEVAGEWLEVQNQRVLQTDWLTPAGGLRLDPPRLIRRTVPLRLSYGMPPPVEVCEARLCEIEAEIKPLTKRLPFLPVGTMPLPIASGDTTSDVYRWMNLRAARYFWAATAGHAKQIYRLGRRPRTLAGVAQILAFSPDLVIVGLPAHMYARPTAALKQRSPFAVTQVWAGMAGLGLMCVIPPEEHRLGGPHSGMAFASEDITAMIDKIAEELQEVYDAMGKSAEQAWAMAGTE